MPIHTSSGDVFFPASHASVLITTDDMVGSASQFKTYSTSSEAVGGGLAVLSVTEGIKFDHTLGRFTVSEAGTYKVTAVTYSNILLISAFLVQTIKKNGSVDLLQGHHILNTSSNYNHSAHVLVGTFTLAANDYIEHLLNTSSGSSKARAQSCSTFMINRIA